MPKITIRGLQQAIKKMHEARESADKIFAEFSNKVWRDTDALTRRIRAAETTAKQAGERELTLKVDLAKITKVAHAFAQHKERDAATIATLTRLLDRATRNFDFVCADANTLEDELLKLRMDK